MAFRTRELLKESETLPTDESSVNFASRGFADEAAAETYFYGLKKRLVDLANWSKNSGMSSYEMYDREGIQQSEQRIRPGAFVKITLHGSGKSDWVRVEDLVDRPDEMIITVRPTFDPTDQPQQTGKTSHFFSADATNNFCAFRDGSMIYLYVIGLNERLNTGHASNILEKARNTAVANLGYYLGIQKAEWTKFCESFLADVPAAE